MNPRDRMVGSAVALLARGGVPAASFSAVLDHSGAPRGSIYHHFPDGKDQLIAAALDRVADGVGAITAGFPSDAPGIIDAFFAQWERLLVATDFAVGCAALGATVTGVDARGVFDAWHAELTRRFAEADADTAADAAAAAAADADATADADAHVAAAGATVTDDVTRMTPTEENSPESLLTSSHSPHFDRTTVARDGTTAGRPTPDALATTVLAAAEGAVVLARAERSVRPLHVVRDVVRALA